METADTRRLGHAALTLEKGRAALPSDPKMGLYWVKSALILRATTLTRLGSDQAEGAIQELTKEAARLHLELGTPISPAEQNDLVIFALSLGNRELAERIVRIPVLTDEYPFTVALVNLLSRALGAPSSAQARRSKVTQAEELLLDDLTSVVEGSPTNLEGTEKFWALTRRRRFANTIHEHRNFFKSALAYLQANQSFGAPRKHDS